MIVESDSKEADSRSFKGISEAEVVARSSRWDVILCYVLQVGRSQVGMSGGVKALIYTL